MDNVLEFKAKKSNMTAYVDGFIAGLQDMYNQALNNENRNKEPILVKLKEEIETFTELNKGTDDEFKAKCISAYSDFVSQFGVGVIPFKAIIEAVKNSDGENLKIDISKYLTPDEVLKLVSEVVKK